MRSPAQRKRDDERDYILREIQNGRTVADLHATIDRVVADELFRLRGADTRARAAEAGLELAHDALRGLADAVVPLDRQDHEAVARELRRARQVLPSTPETKP